MRYQSSSSAVQARLRLRRGFDWILMLVCFGLIVFAIRILDERTAEKLQGAATIVDGDSLILGGKKLRLEGIDAPEYRQICRLRNVDYSCGHKSRQHLNQLIAKHTVECKGWQRDRYARLLVRCTVANIELNREMVSSGWALSYGDFLSEEAAARAAKRGVWQGQFERPSQWRKMRGDLTEVPHDFWLKILSFFKKLVGHASEGEIE